MALIIAQALSILVLAWPAACQFLNGFGGAVHFKCDPGYAINTVQSQGIDNPEGPGRDYTWNFDCVQVSKHVKEYCDEFMTINVPGGSMLFQCPKNSYMSAIKSVYDDDTDDRQWQVKCCRVLGKCTRDCFLTESFSSNINYTPNEEGVFFVGIFSTYDDETMDRTFYVEECKAVDCGRPYYHKYYYPWKNKDKSDWAK